MATLVESKIIRQGGTRAEVGGTKYHFQPFTDGAHVCEIENEEHADAFLGIREGYRLYRGEGQPVSSQAEDAGQADERAALVAQYTELYGTAPHPRAGIPKLREAIAAKQ